MNVIRGKTNKAQLYTCNNAISSCCLSVGDGAPCKALKNSLKCKWNLFPNIHKFMSCHGVSRSKRSDSSNRSWKWLGWLLYFPSLLDEDWSPLHINQHMNGDHFHCVSSEGVLWRTECGEEGSRREKKKTLFFFCTDTPYSKPQPELAF